MEFEVLYYFKFDNNNNYVKHGEIHLSECLNVTINTNKKDLTFKVDCGDRVYQLQSDSEQDRQRWADVLNRVRPWAVEVARLKALKMPIRKNYDQVFA